MVVPLLSLPPISLRHSSISAFRRLRYRRCGGHSSGTTNSSLVFSPFMCPMPSSGLGLNVSYRSASCSFREELFSPCNFVVNAGIGGGDLVQDFGATAIVLACGYGLVFTFDTLSARKLIHQNVSRKVVHILSGLLFMVSWPIFSSNPGARYFASFVPLVNCVRLVIYGFSLANDDRLVKSVTREGNPKELLRGPLYYVVMLILCATKFWRESPIGVISLSMMCGGDGMADIIGRRFGSQKLPYNQHKSWLGSISMFVCGFLISMGMLYYFSILGYFPLDWIQTMHKVALVSLVATLVESLPITQVLDDNISVPLASMAVAYLTFR